MTVKRTAIRRPKGIERKAIKHRRDENGLYEGMPGVKKDFGRLFKIPTEEDHQVAKASTAYRMVVCFGRTNFKISPLNYKLAMAERLEYLKTFGWRLEPRNQHFTSEEERHAMLSSKPSRG